MRKMFVFIVGLLFILNGCSNNLEEDVVVPVKVSSKSAKTRALGNFEDYLNGFSANVQEIIEMFKLRAQIKHMANKDVLLNVLEKFTSPDINLTPFEKLDTAGRKIPALTNLGMGYVFEELIRKFNEENNRFNHSSYDH